MGDWRQSPIIVYGGNILMPEFRYYPKSTARTLIDFTAITELIGVGEWSMVFLPNALIPIIRKLLLERGLWRTTYAIEYREMGYTIPTELEFGQLRQLVLEGLVELENMTTASDIKIGLLAIANALNNLANAQCCTTVGVNVYQGTDGEGDIIFGTDPPVSIGDPDSDPPPDGYDTWDEWYEQLCQNAHAIADSFISTLSNLSYLSVFNLTLLVGAIGAFILMPPSISPMLLFWLAQLVLSLSTLRDLGDWVESNKSDLVCAMYNATDGAGAQTNVRAILRNGLTAAEIDPQLHETILNIAMALLSTDTLNQLYDGSMKVSYPNAICDCLVLPCDFTVWLGEIDDIDVISQDHIYLRVRSVSDPYGPNRHALGIDFPEGAGFGWVLASEAVTGQGMGMVAGHFYNCQNGQVQREYLPNAADQQGNGTWDHNYVWSQYNAQFTWAIELICKTC